MAAEPPARQRRSRVLLIVAGGIAAYKAPDLVRKLIAAGCEVQVVVTEAALGFCTELSLATVSGRPVRRSLLDAGAETGGVGHIELADWPDLVLIAPATADLMARAAAGMANDLASCVLLATRAALLWAPAMNTNMWRHPATRHNLELLAARGSSFVGPDRGELACGWIGEGRMLDPPILAAAARATLDGEVHPQVRGPEAGSATASVTSSALSGRRVVVTAGPTRAFLDPVRFISNASTGAMGFALAAAARARGAEVVLIAGPVALATPAGVRRVDVETGAQMLAACREAVDEGADLLAMVAAVADLVPADPATEKVDKDRVLAGFADMQWRAEVDILATLVREREAGERGVGMRILGFGAQTVASRPGEGETSEGETSEGETGEGEPGAGAAEADRVRARLRELGRAKLARKGCDALFVNRVGIPGGGFASPTNAGLLIFSDGPGAGGPGAGGPGELDSGPSRPKAELAAWMLDGLAARWWSAAQEGEGA
ncbi:bifunctional phosphopantothenoylcysteine decarboxylase/phosphopantothenate--cysteine ligase CoaBC [Pseudenhygromyxa sp. WMMC2535]|uniref:bifunctional phosphopantothenoylcysteine decarboxylase/phosphopantothenate--cysteine ligase CoaBC n=1 Tax=Pseudenhygromyxa sp. WMMC2535 TaxID=2712867 RepID=UPI0015560320|nr:bifunctional phosphopantothenoylcysteine decarboxylase/phosphopantothenate--cysteine ligase CoaBC [Pseudenhygromyxa sp. WMMC2535]NVB41651.1 bifunctional phosphopantothenoylcysteine decarboxylase/phosphopantothenate--cysteine ligase CoaBC [Pseudenhygromyxa sp. WMMC2535]